MQWQPATFVITREDLAGLDPIQLIAEGVVIGRLLSCEVCLNHPLVLQQHAGIKEERGEFYLYNLSHSAATTLNGRIIPAEEAELLADDDVAQIGPFFLVFWREGPALHIRVTLELTSRIGQTRAPHSRPAAGTAAAAAARPAGAARPEADREADDDEVVLSLDVFWKMRRREAGKIDPRQHSQSLGVAGYLWRPTTDLARPLPVSDLILILLPVLSISLFSVVAAGRHWSLLSLGLIDTAALFGVAALIFLRRSGRHRLRLLPEAPGRKRAAADTHAVLSEEDRLRYDPNGPPYPHPVVIAERCIGCRACVDACPHDVFAMVGGLAVPLAPDQCMEDTSCQVECPVNPKACIVVNTSKKIPKRKVPARDNRFMTNVPGCYLVGDVSGTPLIKNAANEGADAIRHVASELRNGAPPAAGAELEVAIVGAGPAGLSAAITARQLGLSYVCVEQDDVLSTIKDFPYGKYVFLKPDVMEMRGTLAVDGPGLTREALLDQWCRALVENQVVVNEGESCRAVRRADDGDYFVVETERGYEKIRVTYRPRRVVLALGNRGTPMRLRVPGEDLMVTLDGRAEFKVRYKLTDTEMYRRRHVIVVGAGNSAVEAAVDLVARRRGDQLIFRPENEINHVTLIVRSDLKNDLKFSNKRQVYQCADEGRLRIRFGAGIREIRESEVVLMHARTQQITETVRNDLIFVMIGGDRPTKFLESIGIQIG